MNESRPGYWHIERCSWVGTEPTHVGPPSSPAAPESISPPPTGSEAESQGGPG